MTERRKRNILIWILALLVICTGCLVFYDVFFSRRPGNSQPEAPVQIPETGGQDRPAATDTEKEDIRIRWREYTVYAFDDLGFRFILANVHIEAEGPTNLTLDHFRTEEGIVLNDTASYVDALEEKSLYLGRQNVSFSLISVEPSYTAVIFIPVKDAERTSLTVSCDIGSTRDMKFQLVNAQGKREQLEYHADDVITDGDTYMMRVSAAYDITGQPLYRTVNGTDTDYPLASTTKVYAFKVEAVSLWGDEVVIESAEYIPSTTGEVFTALSSDIHSLKYDNILGRSVTENDMGYLFFYAYDPDDHPVTYHGVLKLKVRGSQRSISINVDLN